MNPSIETAEDFRDELSDESLDRQATHVSFTALSAFTKKNED
jgi:hypothetical protein